MKSREKHISTYLITIKRRKKLLLVLVRWKYDYDIVEFLPNDIHIR